MLATYRFKQWLKHSESPYAQTLFKSAKACLQGNLPLPLWPYKVINLLTSALYTGASETLRIFWYTPRFKARLKQAPRSLFLYSGMPYLNDSLDITLGERCRISGITTFTGRGFVPDYSSAIGSSSAGDTNNDANNNTSTATHASQNQKMQDRVKSQLTIGNNVGIGWQTTIAVGKRVILHDNVRIAGRGFLAGYPGHPINPHQRATGAADTEAQIGDIELKANVWLGTGCTVLAGVTIGENTIVGAGSLVTKSLPPNVIAGGNPARVLRELTVEELAKQTHGQTSTQSSDEVTV